MFQHFTSGRNKVGGDQDFVIDVINQPKFVFFCDRCDISAQINSNENERNIEMVYVCSGQAQNLQKVISNSCR